MIFIGKGTCVTLLQFLLTSLPPPLPLNLPICVEKREWISDNYNEGLSFVRKLTTSVLNLLSSLFNILFITSSFTNNREKQ